MNYIKNFILYKRIIFTFIILSVGSQANFTYVIKNPNSYDAQKYIVYKSNISILTENSGTSFWHPNIGSNNINNTAPGVIIYHFPLSQNISEGTLFVRTDTFHWDYSRGYSLIFISNDGRNWDNVTETPAPAFGKWNAGNFSASLPSKFIGKKDVYIKVMLYSYGSKAFRGGGMTNTAQYLRYDPSRDNITFQLDIKSANSKKDSLESILENLTSDEHLNALSFDNILSNINQKEIDDANIGKCYVGCEPTTGGHKSCALSTTKENSSGKQSLMDSGMTDIIMGPSTWDECAKTMKKLKIEGW